MMRTTPMSDSFSKDTTNNKVNASTSRRRIKIRLNKEGRPVDSTVEAEPPVIPDPPTEQELRISKVVSSSFELGDDAAKAIARFEADVLLARYRDNDMSEEEFDSEEFGVICGKLAHLKMIKGLLPIFELEDFERDILEHFISEAFGKKEDSPPSRISRIIPSKRVFKGDDEALLDYQAKTSSGIPNDF